MTTILLVEDDNNKRLLYEQELRLELESYEIITAIDGKDAIKKVQEQRPDMIIMDIRMPKMGGIEFTGIILSYTGIPIIINTA